MPGWQRLSLFVVVGIVVVVVVAGGTASAVAAKKKVILAAQALADGPNTARQTDLLKQERELRTVRAELLTKQVLRTIEGVRRQSSQDPDSALGELKRTLASVVSSTDIDPDAR